MMFGQDKMIFSSGRPSARPSQLALARIRLFNGLPTSLRTEAMIASELSYGIHESCQAMISSASLPGEPADCQGNSSTRVAVLLPPFCNHGTIKLGTSKAECDPAVTLRKRLSVVISKLPAESQTFSPRASASNGSVSGIYLSRLVTWLFPCFYKYLIHLPSGIVAQRLYRAIKTSWG